MKNNAAKKQTKGKALESVKKDVKRLTFFLEYQTLDVEYNFA
jgi:hypothetical protein